MARARIPREVPKEIKVSGESQPCSRKIAMLPGGVARTLSILILTGGVLWNAKNL